jgi:hypothetical protein
MVACLDWRRSARAGKSDVGVDEQSARAGMLIGSAHYDKSAASEDRTHDLRIMRPTRYQLRAALRRPPSHQLF